MAFERLTPGTPQWTEWGHHHLQRYVFAGNYVRGKRVLDLACGVGYGSYSLRMMGAESVNGVDLDLEAIAYARENYKRDGLTYEEGNALLWASSGKFDVVVSFETIEHLPCPEDFLDRVADHLHPDGLLIISAPNTLQYLQGTPPVENEYHLNEPDHSTFRSWLDRRFLIEGEWEQSPVLRGSPSHLFDDHELAVQLRKSWVRFANTLEDRLRRISGRSKPAASPHSVKHMKSYTEIIPLLPERTIDCNIFLFVCRKRPI